MGTGDSWGGLSGYNTESFTQTIVGATIGVPRASPLHNIDPFYRFEKKNTGRQNFLSLSNCPYFSNGTQKCCQGCPLFLLYILNS